ncbi:YcxB family protein [Candidatus Sumerlaeota bacterium]|nr:YcxB family protein [Candidatus Sumerlaeota bacterium]
MAAMLGAGRSIYHPSIFGWPIWVVLMLGPGFVFIYLPLFQTLSLWQVRRQNVTLRGILYFTVADWGFETHGGTFEVKLRWDAIPRVVETSRFFLFFISSNVAYFIPKTFLGSHQEMGELRRIIREGMGDKARLQAA